MPTRSLPTYTVASLPRPPDAPSLAVVLDLDGDGPTLVMSFDGFWWRILPEIGEPISAAPTAAIEQPKVN